MRLNRSPAASGSRPGYLVKTSAPNDFTCGISLAADNWLPRVGTEEGNTQPPSGPSTWWYGPIVMPGSGTQSGQSAWVRMFGAWPEICAMSAMMSVSR